MAEGLGAPAGRYSSDLLLTLLQVAVVHLRDQLLAAPRGMPLIMDSYYFKILSKCALLGHANEALFAWWRSFPRPDRVVYLDVPPDVAWQRSGHGASVNAMEHYGERPTKSGFMDLQEDLRRAMLMEVAGLDLHILDTCEDVESTTRLIEKSAVN
jgi:thymidylate kinase